MRRTRIIKKSVSVGVSARGYILTGCGKSLSLSKEVIPAKAGIQGFQSHFWTPAFDPARSGTHAEGFRRSDGFFIFQPPVSTTA